MAALAAASKPSMSALGYAEADPSAVASSNASSNPAPVSSIRVSTKLVVPLTIPRTRLIRSPASDSRRGRSSGMAPATLASKYRSGAERAGRLVQGRAVAGQQRLVGRHHPPAASQRGEHQRARRLDAADHLDDDVDVVALYQAGRVRGEQARVHRQVADPLRSTDGDPG